ncbi:MAG: hypothetical protein ACFE9X_16305 [Promethearchaeota archaeon]
MTDKNIDQDLSFLSEPEIYEPLESSELVSIIPSEDKVFYSAKFNIKYKKLRSKISNIVISHVILTNNGMAFTWPFYFHTNEFCGINNDICYYVPWYTVRVGGLDRLMLAKDFSTTVYEFSYTFTLLEDKELEIIQPYKQRKKELIEKSKILREKSRDNIYNLIAPILKSYPKSKIPSFNPSNICVPPYLYTILRKRVLKEIVKEVKQGIFQYREPITISQDLTYRKERIHEEVKNYNLITGTYDDVMKMEELATAFSNFFPHHSLEEATALLVELFELKPIIVLEWFQKAREYILKKYPEKEKNLFNLEKEFYERTIYATLFEEGEYIVAHFKGMVNLPKAHLEFPGHVMVTNYRVLGPGIPKVSAPWSWMPITGWGTWLLAKGIMDHIVNARKLFLRVFNQNPDMFSYNKPYNIRKTDLGNVGFTMNYNNIDAKPSEKKIYNLIINLIIAKYNKESKEEFKLRKEKIVTDILDLLSRIAGIECPKCKHVQDKKYNFCQMCGKEL